jgi:ATP-dependent DNA ligase
MPRASGACGSWSGGGESIVLKDRRSVYRAGVRSRSWWKAKHKLTLPVEVLQCASALVRWGDSGQAAVMAFTYQATASR